MSTEHVLQDIIKSSTRITAAISLCIAFILGILGNIIVISTVQILMRKKQEIPTILIFIQAMVDCITIIVTYIQPIMTYICGIYPKGHLWCTVHVSLILFFNSFSIFIVIAMVYDRYFAVSKPYCYQERMVFTKQKLTLFMITCLFISTLITLPTVLGFSTNAVQYPGTYCLFTLVATTTSETFMLVFYTLVLSVMLLLVIVGNLSGSLNVRKMFTYRERYYTIDLPFKGSEEYLFIRMSIITTGLFLFIWLPFYIELCLSLSNVHYPNWYSFATARLASLHSVINPWLHPILRRKFRKSFKWVFKMTLFYCCCGLTDRPIDTLEHILRDEQHYAQQARMSIIDEQEHNEFATNVMFNLAQRNIIDYVDAPDMHGYGPDTFRDYGDSPVTSRTPPLKQMSELVIKSTLGTIGLHADYEDGEFHVEREVLEEGEEQEEGQVEVAEDIGDNISEHTNLSDSAKGRV